MTDLTNTHCVPCEGGTEPLKSEEIAKLKSQIPNWTVAQDERSISREFKFENFVDSVVFITDVAHVAEEEGHHPDLYLHDYKFVTVTLSTHAIHGLSENDFIVAAKIDMVHNDAR